MSNFRLRTLKEFQKFYADTLLRELRLLEQMRLKVAKKTKIQSKIISAIFIGLLIVLVLIDIDVTLDKPIIFCIILVLWLAAWAISMELITLKYRKEFNLRIFKKIIEFIDRESEHSSDSCITWEMFDESKLFPKIDKTFKPKRYDLGTIGQSSIAFARWGADSRDNTEKTSISRLLSKSLFFAIDLNKSFNGITTVLVSLAEDADNLRYPPFCYKNSFSGILQDNIVRWEYWKFYRVLVVCSNNEIEARHILFTKLKTKLIRFHLETGSRSTLYVSFVNSRMYIKIDCHGYGLEQPRVFESILEFSFIENYFYYLQLPIKMVGDIVEYLNKNL